MSDLATEIAELKRFAPDLDWARIESALIDGLQRAVPREPVTFESIYGVTHTPVSHEFQCNWKVVNVRGGVVTWRCWCGKRQSRPVRVYGVMPPALFFKSNWPYGIIGCPLCATIYNAETAKCTGKWHEANR